MTLPAGDGPQPGFLTAGAGANLSGEDEPGSRFARAAVPGFGLNYFFRFPSALVRRGAVREVALQVH